MKYLNKIFMLVSVFAIMSCGNGKNATSTSGTQKSGTTVAKSTDNSMDNAAIAERRGNSTSSNAAFDPVESKYGEINALQNNSSEYESKRWEQLYTDLNMTEDQISRFETNSRSAMDTWKTKNTQRDMNNEEKMTLESSTLKLILTPTQYSNYQQWLKDN